MAEQYKTYKRDFWVQKEDTLYTVGLNEDGIEEFEKIMNVDAPMDGEKVDAGAVCGSIDTDKGPIDLYSPVTGTIIEVNSLVVEEPSLIQDDPYDAWLFKVESDDDAVEDDEDDEDLDEDEEDDDLEEELEEDDEEE